MKGRDQEGQSATKKYTEMSEERTLSLVIRNFFLTVSQFHKIEENSLSPSLSLFLIISGIILRGLLFELCRTVLFLLSDLFWSLSFIREKSISCAVPFWPDYVDFALLFSSSKQRAPFPGESIVEIFFLVTAESSFGNGYKILCNIDIFNFQVQSTYLDIVIYCKNFHSALKILWIFHAADII